MTNTLVAPVSATDTGVLLLCTCYLRRRKQQSSCATSTAENEHPDLSGVISTACLTRRLYRKEEGCEAVHEVGKTGWGIGPEQGVVG